MTVITRGQWLEVLKRLSPYGMKYVHDLNIFSGIDYRTLEECIAYLSAHRLIKSHCQETLDGKLIWGGIELTAKGFDYLSEDGGLTAEDKTIIVKLDGDTIKALLYKAVDDASAPEGTKSGLKQKVKALGGEALKDLTSSLISKGVESAPDLIQWLGTTLG